jgi:hypothetical protein
MMTQPLSTYKYWAAYILTSVNSTLTEVSFTYLTEFHNAYISLVVIVLTSGRV